MDPIDAAWLAGLLEGEGCFLSSKRAPASPSIRLGMADKDVVERAALLMGTTARIRRYMEGGDRKPLWMATLNGEAAYRVMCTVLPHMGERRAAKIRELVEARDARRRLICIECGDDIPVEDGQGNFKRARCVACNPQRKGQKQYGSVRSI